MSAGTVLLVGVGAAVGAPLRYLVDTAAKARFEGAFPWGTFVVNVVGSLVLGFLTGASAVLPAAVSAAVGTGLCGALTTYSTFSYELLALAERRLPATAVTYLVGGVVGGVAAAAAGWATARTVL